MAKKTPVDKLGEAVQKILDDYQDDTEANLETITKKMGQKGVQALKQQSKKVLKQHSGDYAKGWNYSFFKKTRLYARATIRNKQYMLSHLLEHGHATRNGDGRVYPDTPAHEHIAPVAESLTEAYEREVLSKL